MTPNRRTFLRGMVRLGGSVAGLGLLARCAPPLAPAATAPPRVYRVGFLSGRGSGSRETLWNALGELGYVEGQNLITEERVLVQDEAQTRAAAAEFAAIPVDVIVVGGEPAIRAAMAATTSIPIVMQGGASDPVALGFVESLARPGGNVTGVWNPVPEAEIKGMQLLLEAVPGVTRVAVLGPAPPDSWEQPAQALGIELFSLPVTARDGYEPAFERAHAAGAEALITRPALANDLNVDLIPSLATRYHLPGVYPRRPYVAAGGLMAYSARPSGMGLQVANYVDRILRGARPADLPVDQPTRYDLILNLGTARALGLILSPTFLARVDELIE
jgi:putative ABC transport system substrate-binding protein